MGGGEGGGCRAGGASNGRGDCGPSSGTSTSTSSGNSGSSDDDELAARLSSVVVTAQDVYAASRASAAAARGAIAACHKRKARGVGSGPAAGVGGASVGETDDLGSIDGEKDLDGMQLKIAWALDGLLARRLEHDLGADGGLKGAPGVATAGQGGSNTAAVAGRPHGGRMKRVRADGGPGAAPVETSGCSSSGGMPVMPDAEAGGDDEALGVRMFRRVRQGTPCSLVTPGERTRRRLESTAATAASAARVRTASERLLPPRLVPPDPCDTIGAAARAVELLGASAAALARELAEAGRAQRTAAAPQVRMPTPGVVLENPRPEWVPHEVRVLRLLGGGHAAG